MEIGYWRWSHGIHLEDVIELASQQLIVSHSFSGLGNPLWQFGNTILPKSTPSSSSAVYAPAKPAGQGEGHRRALLSTGDAHIRTQETHARIVGMTVSNVMRKRLACHSTSDS